MPKTNTRKRIIGLPLILLFGLFVFHHGTYITIDENLEKKLATRDISQLYDSPQEYQGLITNVTGVVISSGYLIDGGYFVMKDIDTDDSIFVITRQFSPDKSPDIIKMPLKIVPSFKMDGVSSIWAIHVIVE